MKCDVFILAGGQGTRLRELFPATAKPVVPMGETPFLHRLLKAWATPHVKRFVISVGHLAEQVRSSVGSSFAGIPVDYVHEHNPLGTGGAVLHALSTQQLSYPFVLLNGDTYCPVDVGRLTARPEDYVMALTRVPDAARAGRVQLNGQHQVTAVLPPARGPALANTGVAFVRRLNFQSERSPLSLEQDILPALIARGPVGAIEISQRILDIGTPEGHRETLAYLQDHGE